MPLTAEHLRLVLSYDPATGLFTWIAKRRGILIGRTAGALMSHGYIGICLDRRDYTAHRLAWLYMTGAWPAGVIDHINGIRNDNRFCNLRSVTQVENMQNVRSARRDSTTGFRGVSLHKRSGKYTARITVDGKYLSLGLHVTPEAASAAYEAARQQHHQCFR